MQQKERCTRAELASTVHEWFEFSGPVGLNGDYGRTTEESGHPVWITRVRSSDRRNGYAYTMFDLAAWKLFASALARHRASELVRT
ncbi:hypothetical protein ACQPXB_21220 [Amycolatopsis sp. CA-161197]|uniref:hypothetical protein n=1 Tax=Amycolatopsis sp. CA-161197 TaxID=3239922 RepID=UPI003D911F1E